MPRLVRTQREMEGELIDVWALVDPEDELEPWGADLDHVSVGRPHTRTDAPLRAAGRARFTVDVSLPGMLHAAVLRSPHAHAAVEALELDEARQMPGVRAVIGPWDEVPSPSVPNIRSPRPLLNDEPMFVGEAIAAVAADTPEQAEAAVAVLAPRYRVLPFDVDPEHALRVAQRYVFEPFELRRGEAETELEAADVRIELTLDTPVHHTTPIEPHAAVAEWQGDDLCLWVSTQGTFMARSEIAAAGEARGARRPTRPCVCGPTVACASSPASRISAPAHVRRRSLLPRRRWASRRSASRCRSETPYPRYTRRSRAAQARCRR